MRVRVNEVLMKRESEKVVFVLNQWSCKVGVNTPCHGSVLRDERYVPSVVHR